MPGPVREVAWRLVLPEIRKIVKEELDSQLRGVNGRIDSVAERIDGLEGRRMEGSSKPSFQR